MFEAQARSGASGYGSGYLAAFGIVLASTAVAEILYNLLHTNRLSTVFLAGVLITAVNFGSGPAYFAALVAFGIYNFYLVEPRFTLSTFSVEDVLLLTIFLGVAMLTGRLAGRVRDQAAAAQARARTAGALFEASRGFSDLNDDALIRNELLKHVSQACGGPAVMWRHWQAIVEPAETALPGALTVALAAGPTAAAPPGWRIRPLFRDEQESDRVAWRESGPGPRRREEDSLIDVLVDVGAAAIVRARLAAAESEVRAFTETERLRNALLSSISHDLRTPLASILASASSLREFGERFEPSVREDLVSTIQEEAERLNQFVANLLQMTRLEGGALGVRAVRMDIREVCERIVTRLERRAGRRRLALVAEDDDLVVLADPILLEQALANLVENAIRFSPDGSEILLTGRKADGCIVVEVSDEGPGVPPEDLCRIFEKFYRSPASSANLQGTGLGLSIVKGFVESMDGKVTARRRKDTGAGLSVSIALPLGGQS